MRPSGSVPLTATRIGVLMGGQSAEREISLRTGEAVYAALVRRGYHATRIDVDGSLPFKLRARRVQLAFLALHGRGGEDGTVQGLLEIMGIPYTGSGVQASAMSMNKPVAKAFVQMHGVPVAPGVVVQRTGDRTMPSQLAWPLVVKPANEGSTVGVSVVRKPSQWRRALQQAFEHDQEVLVESFIDGRELTVSVLDGEALPSIEIVAPHAFYDYAAKYEKRETRYVCPAPVTKSQEQRVKALAVRAYRVMGCAGAARMDFRLNRYGRPVFLEINTIPGMTRRSLLPMSAAEAGLDYDSLTERILQSGLVRQSSWAVPRKDPT